VNASRESVGLPMLRPKLALEQDARRLCALRRQIALAEAALRLQSKKNRACLA